MGLDALVNGVKTLTVVCNQWGDTGKGKFVDYFGEWADIIARGTGGANAGHTIILGEQELIFHLIPSGIVHDADGKINVLGSGMAFDPRVVKEELELLDENNISYSHLMISHNAHLVLPQHLVMDRVKESSSGETKIGTTGRGIGPVYTDHVARIGLTVKDMLNKDIFSEKLKINLKDKVTLLKQRDPELVKQVMSHEHLRNMLFYDPQHVFDIDTIVDVYTEYGKEFKHMITDTDGFMKNSVGKKKILLEGAQGLLLSKNYGTKPYVTSSDPSVLGLSEGVGLSEKNVDLTLGVVKAFYMTRVGGGPFPTEFGGKESEKWCDTHRKEQEESEYPHVTVNSEDEFQQGIGIRFAGGEYGATTRRPRRTGWLDLPLLRYATTINGHDVILTKVDVLDGCEKIKICDSYTYTGPDYDLGKTVLRAGDKISVAIPDSEVLEHCKPTYQEFPGWKSDITGIRTYGGLSDKLKNMVEYVEKHAGVHVRAISVGSKRQQTIIR